jgi:cation:H+ antiporter
LLWSLAAMAGGLALLVWGADRFVLGAAATASNLGVAPIIVGMTIVGFGTSAPEILISVFSALQGLPGLAIGNALGSNIANIALILGATAAVAPLLISSQTLRREYPLLLATTLIAYLLSLDGGLTRLDGVILLLLLASVLYLLVLVALVSRRTDPMRFEYQEEIPGDVATPVALAWLLVGLLVLVIGSKLLVWGAVDVARALGVSELVIGLTIVALGTSLPELATSVTSAVKGQHDIAIGNIIGSNMFNQLAVFGLPALISPGVLEPDVLSRDFPVVIALTLALLIMAWGARGPGRINRVEGFTLLGAYLLYQWVIYLQATGGIDL